MIKPSWYVKVFRHLELDVWDEKIPNDCDEIFRMELPASYNFLSLLGSPIEAFIELIDNYERKKFETVAFSLELAANEVFTNIVEHAYVGANGFIELYYCLDQAQCRFTIGICDHGRPFKFDPSAVRLPESDQTRGYGLYLILHLLDEVHYWSEGERNHWRLVKVLCPS